MKAIKKTIVFLLLIITLFTLTSCSNKPKVYSYVLNGYFNTVSNVRIIYDKFDKLTQDEYSQIVVKSENLMERLDSIFNRYSIESEVYKVNKANGEFVLVSDELIELLDLVINQSKLVKEFCGRSIIDPTVGSLTSAWNFKDNSYFNNYEYHTPPTEEKINEALAKIDYNNIVIEGNNVKLLNNAEIDLGAFVKGYACNKLKSLLIEEKITRAIIDLGGNIDMIGSLTSDRLYECGIVNPFYMDHLSNSEVQSIGSLLLSDTSLVTSGGYERYIKSDIDTKYHHILDLQTGYSCNNNMLSVSVIAKDSLLCDSLSTALFIMGLDDAFRYVNSIDGVEIVVVYEASENYEVYISKGLENNFKYNDKLNELNFVYKGVY